MSPPNDLIGDRDLPRGDAVRLEQDDVCVGLPARGLAGDDRMQLLHLQLVELTRGDRVDQIRGLEPRVLE